MLGQIEEIVLSFEMGVWNFGICVFGFDNRQCSDEFIPYHVGKESLLAEEKLGQDSVQLGTDPFQGVVQELGGRRVDWDAGDE